MKIKWVILLLMAVAIYLTTLSVNLCTTDWAQNFWCGTMFYDNNINPSVFFQTLSLLQIIMPIATVFLYLTVFGLLYHTYWGQFQKVTRQQVIGIVGLQSFVVALVCTVVTVICWVLLVFEPYYTSLHSLLVSYVCFLPMLLFPLIMGAFLLAGVCFVFCYMYPFSSCGEIT